MNPAPLLAERSRLVTTIGRSTEERLFDFDLEALRWHAERLAQLQAEALIERELERERIAEIFHHPDA